MNKIEIYTNETCGYCKQVKEELSKNNIEFEERDTLEYKKEFGNATSLVNMGTVPLLVVNGNTYLAPARDFSSPQHLTSILTNFVEPTFDETKGCLERIKTLNYHISLAFNRLEQTLRQLEVKLNTEEDEHKSTS